MKNVNRDVAPVIAAQALHAHGMADDKVTIYVQRTFRLDFPTAIAAVNAAHILSGDSFRPVAVAPTPTGR